MRTVIKFYSETSIDTCIAHIEEFLRVEKRSKIRAISHTVNSGGFDTILVVFEIKL